MSDWTAVDVGGDTVSEFHINGEILTTDESAIINALVPPFRYKKKEDLLFDDERFSMSVYADGDHFMVSAVMHDASQAEALERAREIGRQLTAAGVRFSLEVRLEDGTDERIENLGRA